MIYNHLSNQSDPDWYTTLTSARNTDTGCNTAPCPGLGAAPAYSP